VSYVYSKGTPFENHALKNIELNIAEGTITGIIGHTGSGKSTLVRLFNGLERPTSGSVLLEGEDIWSEPKSIGKIRFKVGLVMQYPEYQLFEETVRADIAFGPKNMGLPQEEIDERVARYSALVGLDPSILDKSPFELSGGQKRRVAIAGIMAMKPRVLVLDEPAAGLDPEGRKNLFDAIDEYRRSENATVIIVSHSMEDMAERCDRIAVLFKGELIASGLTSEVFSDPQILIDAGLDVPEITRIIMLIAEKGFRCDKAVYTVDQAVKFVLSMVKEGNI
jgi:energy-coupling factor transport system ATP-binding protein